MKMIRNMVLAGSIGLAGCAGDPTEQLRDEPASVSTSLSFARILVGDSAGATAQTKDAQGNALPQLPTIESGNSSVALIRVDEVASGNPVPETVFNIIAVDFGVTIVTATTGSISSVINVQTFPAAVEVTGITSGTQVPVGASVTLTAVPVGTSGQPTTGNTVTWSSQDTTVATVNQQGVATARAPGLAIIVATSEGNATGQVSFEVVN